MFANKKSAKTRIYLTFQIYDQLYNMTTYIAEVPLYVVLL